MRKFVQLFLGLSLLLVGIQDVEASVKVKKVKVKLHPLKILSMNGWQEILAVK